MLACQNSCGYKNADLLTAGYCLACCPHGDFCFSESHIAAYQTLHRLVIFHALINIMYGRELIIGFVILKSLLKLFQENSVIPERKAGFHLSVCVKLQQVYGKFLCSGTCLNLKFFPCACL